MKTTMKKFIPLLMMAGTLMGCTMHGYKAGPIQDLVGLYELEMIKKKHEVDDTDTYDYMSEIGAKAYFTITKDGYGYYGYKDNKTAARVDQVFSKFEYDTNDEKHPDYIKGVTMGDGLKDVNTEKKEVGCLDEPQLGFHDTALKKYLEYTIPYYRGTINKKYVQYYQYAQYKRIGDDTSLKNMNKLMGTNVKFTRPFEMKAMTRFMIYSCVRNAAIEDVDSRFGYYDYAFLDVDSYKNGTIKFYYRETAEGIDRTANARVQVLAQGHTVSVNILNKSFENQSGGKLLNSYLNTQYVYDLENDHYIYESFANYQGTAATPAELITELTTAV